MVLWHVEVVILQIVPDRKLSFPPISASDSNFNPRNTTSITACPVGPADRTGVVKFFVFLDLNEKSWFSFGH